MSYYCQNKLFKFVFIFHHATFTKRGVKENVDLICKKANRA